MQGLPEDCRIPHQKAVQKMDDNEDCKLNRVTS